MKKIKDLTKEELLRICDNHNCDDCPLRVPNVAACKNWDGFIDKFKEEEVKVPDERNQTKTNR